MWLEGRPAAYLSRLHITPQLEAGKATFAVTVHAEPGASGKTYRLTVASADGSFPRVTQQVDLKGEATEATLDVLVPGPTWSQESPHLYDCTVRLEPEDGSEGAADVATTYFGLRSVSRGRWEGNPYEYALLNGQPVYLRGVLDQALHPDALHGYPSDDAIRADVQAAKDLGLNMLRCRGALRDPAQRRQEGGLNLYGARMGAFPLGPTVLLEVG